MALFAENMEKTLEEFDVVDGCRLKCDDFLQEYNVVLNIAHA